MDLTQLLKENESLARLMKDKRGKAVIEIKEGIRGLERKADITSATISTSGNDYTTSGVIPIGRGPLFVPGARQRLWLRDLLTVIPTEFGVIDYPKAENDIIDASPHTEAGDKLENQLTLATATAKTRTIATWKRASRQILEDLPGFQAFLQDSLRYAVLKEEQDQLLLGSNSGEQLNGLITQATAFDTTHLVSGDGWELADLIGRSCQMLEEADESPANLLVLHPTTYWNVRMTKSVYGEFLYPGPNLFELVPIRSNALTLNQFLVGSTAPTDAVIRERGALRIELATSDASNFAANMVTVRAEERIALVVYRPGAYITGTSTQSPA